MTSKETVAHQILDGLMREGWQSNGHRPSECGEYRDLVTQVWEAWQQAEGQDPGSGHVAARAAYGALDRDGAFAHLLSDEPKPLPATEKGYTTEDYITVMSQLGYTFALNACDDRVEANGAWLTDVQEAVIRTKLRDRGLKCTNKAHDACIAAAVRNTYHPVKRQLESLRWDGKDHISSVAHHFHDRQGKFPLYFGRWLVGAVARVYEQAQNRMLVLDGPQDIGKSYWVQWLASPLSDYFVESPIDPRSNDHYLRLMRTFIWEVDELGSTTRQADRDALKHFITVPYVTARKPYGRYDLHKPALASFIGTVNNDAGFLNDPTGSRRFMVCTIENLDWGYTHHDVNQVWAQAYALYRAGEPWRLEGAEAAEATALNAQYEIEDPLDDLLRIHFDVDPARTEWILPTIRILERLHEKTGWHLKSPKAEAMRVSSALKKLGLTKDRVTDPASGKRVNGYLGIRQCKYG